MPEQAAPRPFCGEWPFSGSDLDLVLPEDNDRTHKARGCCDGWLPAPTSKDHEATAEDREAER